jgi:ferric-dicitrate binding protein FerR (iron transport regulator)
MNTHQANDNQTSESAAIVEEAALWLECLMDPPTDPGDPYRDRSARHGAFFNWVRQSPAHLRAFMEIVELDRRIRRVGSGEIRSILQSIKELSENVITALISK